MDSLGTAKSLALIAAQPISDILFNPGARQYWAYLLAAFMIVLAVYLVRSKRPRIRAVFRFCFPRRVFLHRSARADYWVWLINAAILAGLLFPLATAIGAVSYQSSLYVLQHASGVATLNLSITVVAIVGATVLNLLALDLSLFLAHLACHKIPLLWEFHKVHHSAAVLTPFTAFRVHPVELLFVASTFAVIANVTAAFVVFLYSTNPALTFSGVNVLEMAFYFAGFHLRHSHVWIMYPGWIGRHISSPALHLIHHSADPKHRDKNLAQIFTLWDRLAGTLYLPQDREKIVMGIGGGHDADFANLANLYFQPLYAVSHRLRLSSPDLERTPR